MLEIVKREALETSDDARHQRFSWGRAIPSVESTSVWRAGKGPTEALCAMWVYTVGWTEVCL